MKKPQLLPDITDYLESIDHTLPVSTAGLERIRGAIVSKTKLNDFDSKIILRLFFQEIRNQLLRKSLVDIRTLGCFYISSPVTSDNSKKIFVKFEPKKSFTKKINARNKINSNF